MKLSTMGEWREWRKSEGQALSITWTEGAKWRELGPAPHTISLINAEQSQTKQRDSGEVRTLRQEKIQHIESSKGNTTS